MNKTSLLIYYIAALKVLGNEILLTNLKDNSAEQRTVLPTDIDWVTDVTLLPFCPLWVVYWPSGFTEAVHFSFRIYFNTSYLASNGFPKEILPAVLHLNYTSPCPFPDHTLFFSKDLWACHLPSDPHLGGRDVKSAHAQHPAQTCCSGCTCAVVIVTCTYAVHCCC